MKTLLSTLYRILSEGEDAVLVSIVAAEGSTPRKSGASMIVTSRGRQFGTIGGGAVELNSEKAAVGLIREKRSCLKKYRLHPNEIDDIGMICGGDNDIYFRYFGHEDANALALLKTAVLQTEEEEPSWLIFEIAESEKDGITLYSQKNGISGNHVPDEVLNHLTSVCECLKTEKNSFYCCPLTDTGKVFLFGAGHISAALAPLLKKLGFTCAVYDDREEYLASEAFDGIETEKIDPQDISVLAAGIREADYICIMTHGHKDDYEIQRQVMKTPARYIGVIGSARKQKAVKEKLLADGYREEDFRNVVSPIGLNIGANTPQEIAVCIAAQLIMVRSGRGFGERDWKR